MNADIISGLALIASGVAVMGLAAMWRRLTKPNVSEVVIITRKDTNKSMQLPKQYSPSAVKALSELVA